MIPGIKDIPGIKNVLGSPTNIIWERNSTPAPPALTEGLVAGYNLEETSGTTTFDNYGSNNATTNALINQAGKLGKAYSFTLEQRILVPNSSDFSFTDGTNDTPFSISYWINKNSIAYSEVISKRTLEAFEWQLDIYSAKPRILCSNNTGAIIQAQSNTSITANVWQMVTITYDGSETSAGFKIYLNDANVTGTGTATGTYNGMVQTTAPVTIGRAGYRMSSPWYSVDGLMDQVLFWKNRELTQQEITTLHNNGNGITL